MKPSQYNIRIFWGIVFLVAVLLLCVGCKCVAKALRQPLPEIVGTTAEDGAPGFDYTVWVKCIVRNNGAAGEVEVFARLQNGGYWKKRVTVFVPENGERKVTFKFQEATFLGTGLSGYEYACGVREWGF